MRRNTWQAPVLNEGQLLLMRLLPEILLQVACWVLGISPHLLAFLANSCMPGTHPPSKRWLVVAIIFLAWAPTVSPGMPVLTSRRTDRAIEFRPQHLGILSDLAVQVLGDIQNLPECPPTATTNILMLPNAKPPQDLQIKAQNLTSHLPKILKPQMPGADLGDVIDVGHQLKMIREAFRTTESLFHPR